MKTETIIIVALVVIIILMIMYRRGQWQQNIPPANRPAAPAMATPPAPGLNYNLNLAIGTTGPEVTLLQSWLQVPITGTFDQATAAALQQAIGQGTVTLNNFAALAPASQTHASPSIGGTLSGPDLSAIGLAGGGIQFV